ncbi:MAG: hypothetical protein CVU57_14475 [Deltaproteobacteria bacterium HGW-Deltaproteobacteria-15]|jgi:O-antigen ligase|nr:MAG: hypothetical protein CVU57_14475 [Deltaproteobacteria bacterium HGW-Deltaproteobacteria-15]
MINDHSSGPDATTRRWNASIAILFLLTLTTPVIVLPWSLENAFVAPKSALILAGISILLGIYILKCINGSLVLVPGAGTTPIFLLLIVLNFSSFFYTENYYYTVVAAALNTACLLLFYFVSIYMDGKKALWLFVTAAAAGFLVSLETWLQFLNVFVLFPRAQPGFNVVGTIGNSNYLGAYLLSVLLIVGGLAFIGRGYFRWISIGLFAFVFAAFLFSRARASWLGFGLSFPLFLYLMARIHGYRLRVKPAVAGALAVLVVGVGVWYFAPEQSWRSWTSTKTLNLRTQKYSASSWWLFKKSPLFGQGLWSYRNLVYSAQAEINKSDPEFFKNYPEPKPRRVHNEFLEILNDGGLLAAVVLALFMAAVMGHGWRVVRNDAIDSGDRIISATAFSSIIAILVTAVFFFPFRVSSTLFMTALMLGIMECMYLRNYGLLSIARFSMMPGLRLVLTPVAVLVLVGFFWYTGIRPLMGELEHFEHRNALAQRNYRKAEEHLLKAIDWDQRNTAYCMAAAQLYMGPFQELGKARDFIERAIVDFNGDITLYSLYLVKGVLQFRMGNLYEARNAFEKALYYYPEFPEARQKLQEVRRVIKDHDQILIKFR